MAAVDAAAMATVATGEMVDALTCQLYKQVGKKVTDFSLPALCLTTIGR